MRVASTTIPLVAKLTAVNVTIAVVVMAPEITFPRGHLKQSVCGEEAFFTVMAVARSIEVNG